MKLRSTFKIPAFIAIVVALLSGPSCSVKKNNILSREYHKTLAHYNGYFNAREKVKDGAKTLATSQLDRYDRILPVFKYGDPASAKAVFPGMDEAIKKVSLVIQRHSMDIDGKERNKWIEDCFLLIGIAQFYKHETWTAIESFQYVAAQYRSEPIRYDALLWLTQSYLRLGKMPDADYLLTTFRDDPKMPTDLKSLYNAIYGDYYLLQNEYEKAAEHLEKATAIAKKKQDRIRYAFILWQIYQKLGEYPKAVTKYEMVIKSNPAYEMSFNARVNRARCIDVNSPDGKEIRKMLVKMLTDFKNLEYQDQIYYALAEISLKENNTPEAIDFLRKSTASSTVNTNQKALSYLKLAEIYFKEPNYKLAQTFYDSTAAFLSQDYPDYLSIINTKNNLNKLIKNLNIILVEDSLQNLASKSPAEREMRIDRMIANENELKELEAKAKAEQKALDEAKANEEGEPSFNAQDPRPGAPVTPGGGSWYFSNQSAISFGYNDFLRIWGDRKLEDNWRRSTKSSFAAAANPDEFIEEVDSTEVVDVAKRDSIMALDNAKRKDAYLASLPTIPELIAKSNDKIVEAYYNVGLIYKEQLKDNPSAGKNFETLLTRYPENLYKVPTIYNLYRVYLAMGEMDKSDYYKNVILKDYADTEYAKIILNPDYFKDQQKKVAIQKVFYENTYRAYLNKQYEDVIERKSLADSLFPGTDLAPKFDLLKSMAIGKTRPIPEFEASLKSIVVKYPDDSVTVRAKEILALIDPSMYNRKDSVETQPEGQPKPEVVEPPKAPVPFVMNADTAQYVFILYQNNVISTNELKIAVSNYNNKFYSVKKLQISSAFLGSESQFVLIREFTNKEEALRYLDGLLSDPVAFGDIDVSSARSVTITPDNMILLMQTKDMEGYERFYDENYLN
ncbi:MAG: tetratricopeptide repeat protein [Bacteroidetes bacterium]|nr:tetratricopeptide repeat protein [Bacteroidota bacterium]